MRNLLKNYKIFNIDAKKLRSENFYASIMDYRDQMMKKFSYAIKKPDDFECLLCHKKNKKSFLVYKNYILFECPSCGLVSPNIDFDKLEFEEVYHDEAYIKDTTRELLGTYDYRKNTYAPERLSYILEKIKDIPAKKIKLLDEGSGAGYFLSYLKDKKISYKGLEMSDFLVQFSKKLGLNVESTDLKDEKDASYNIITLYDVLEHLTDPVDKFKTLNKKLMPGGYVLAYSPHIHSMAYMLMKENQNTLYPFHHVAFFDEKSLNYLAEKTGFTIHSIDYCGLDVIDYLCMKKQQDNFDYLEKLKDFIPLMQAILDKQNMSNHLRVIFKKKP